MLKPRCNKLHVLLAALTLLGLGGCTAFDYYLQSVRGHFELIGKRQPIDEVLADPGTDAPTRARLHLVQHLRRFASEELLLPDNQSYRSYADLERDFVVWNVFATPELSLQPINWCFLVVGCLDYRGYFSRVDAERFAAELRQQGNDVYVGGVTAYSTLGWFDDPVLNTMLRWGDTRLAEVLFHELAHQRLYIKDDTAFNEAFATAVAQAGLHRWLKSAVDDATEAKALNEQARSSAFVRLTGKTRKTLETVFISERSDSQKRAEKKRAYAELSKRYANFKSVWNDYRGYDEWMQDLNNAKLQSIATYHEAVGAFENLLLLANQELDTFYIHTTAISKLPADTRHACLDALAALAALATPLAENGRSDAEMLPEPCFAAISSPEM
jgi:predicted aminopeptidase